MLSFDPLPIQLSASRPIDLSALPVGWFLFYLLYVTISAYTADAGSSRKD